MVEFSIAVFQSTKTGAVLLFPMGFNKDGIRTAVDKTIFLSPPYTNELLGESIRKCFSITVNGDYGIEDLNKPVLEHGTGIKSYSRFLKEYLKLSIGYYPDEGFTIAPLAREKNGYTAGFRGEVAPIKLSFDVSNSELADMILDVFKLCK